jgi:hypothetical protein
MGAMALDALPAEHYGVFLWMRRGVPLILMLGFLLVGFLLPHGFGWWALAAMAMAGVAMPTFTRGEHYLRARRAIILWDGMWVRLFRPLARLFGKEDAWILSFCGWNNYRVREAFASHKARRSLILLPHCVQLSKCKAPILDDLEKCYDCGLCPVGDYMHGILDNGWESRITNRSHKAYRETREYRPDLIVAISCPDRLLKGLTKLSEVPAYVIPLTLSHGMCVDTQFSVPHLIVAMRTLAEPKLGPRPLEGRKDQNAESAA